MKGKHKKLIRLVKAYNNAGFLNSPQARLIRVLSEMLEPQARFRKYGIRDTVVFFGSAKIMTESVAAARLKKITAMVDKTKTPSPALSRQRDQAERDVLMSRYYEDAVQLSRRLTEHFHTLRKRGKNFMVCSGGGPGIMEAANYGAKKAGGESIGLNISLPIEQYPNPYQTEELAFEFHYFFIRKFWFFYLAKALVVFPGGFGTMDELFELLTLMQTGKSKKRMSVILFGSDYWHTVINFNKMIEWGTIAKEDMKLFKIADSVDEAFNILKEDLETISFSHPRGRLAEL